MINIIRQILQKDTYCVKEFDNQIIIFKGEVNYYPEDYIEVQNIDDQYIILEVHRDDKRIKAETVNIKDAAIYAAVICKRLFDNMIDSMAVQNIRNYIDLREEDKAIDYIRNEIEESIYSIGSEIDSKISLIQKNNEADVKFSNRYIVKNASLSRGYVVLFNYSKKLMHITEFYHEKIEKLDSSLSLQDIKTLYIFGE